MTSLESRLRSDVGGFIEASFFLSGLNSVRKFVEGLEDYLRGIGLFDENYLPQLNFSEKIVPDVESFFPNYLYLGAEAKNEGREIMAAAVNSILQKYGYQNLNLVPDKIKRKIFLAYQRIALQTRMLLSYNKALGDIDLSSCPEEMHRPKVVPLPVGVSPVYASLN